MEPSTTHRTHDESLVVRLYGADVSETERERALSLVAGCDSCAALFADLGAIATATAALPVPPRPRDFTICAEDAELLRPAPQRSRAGVLGLGWLRSLGGSLVALGLAGFVLIGGASVLPQMAGNTSDTHYANLTTTDTAQRGVAGVATGPYAAATAAAAAATGLEVPAAVQGGKSAGSPAATSAYGVNGSTPIDAAGSPATPLQSAGGTPGPGVGQIVAQTSGGAGVPPQVAVATSPAATSAPDLRLPAAVGSALLILLGLFVLLRPRRA